MDKRIIAEGLFRQGYNCAQAVVLAYQEELGLSKDQLAKMMSSFGGGIGRLREVCGAVSGGVFVLGALQGYSDTRDAEAKAQHYRAVQDFAKAFSAKNGSIICKELLGVDADGNHVPSPRTDEYYSKRPCAMMVGDAVELLDSMLNK